MQPAQLTPPSKLEHLFAQHWCRGAGRLRGQGPCQGGPQCGRGRGRAKSLGWDWPRCEQRERGNMHDSTKEVALSVDGSDHESEESYSRKGFQVGRMCGTSGSGQDGLVPSRDKRRPQLTSHAHETRRGSIFVSRLMGRSKAFYLDQFRFWAIVFVHSASSTWAKCDFAQAKN